MTASDAHPTLELDVAAMRSRPWNLRLGDCFRTAFKPALRIALWLIAITVPVSFSVLLLDHSGALAWIADRFAPFFGLLGLPGESALVFVTAAMLNNYAAIAVIEALGLGGRSATILALMVLITHNLPVEVAVQRRSGLKTWLSIPIRLLASAVGAIALNALLPAETATAPLAVQTTGTRAFWPAVLPWLTATGALCLKMVTLIVALMVLQRILEEFGVIRWLSRLLHVPLQILGLPPRTAFLWIVANTLGLAYGAGIIIDHVERGSLSDRDVLLINSHVAVCHALLEDTLLFVAIGVPAFWITVPRIGIAASVVWSIRLAIRLWGCRTRKPASAS